MVKPPGMMPPPSSPAGGPPKEQPKDGNKPAGAPNGSSHPDGSPQNHPSNPTQPGVPSAGNPQGNTAPPTPSGTSSTITASPSAVNASLRPILCSRCRRHWMILTHKHFSGKPTLALTLNNFVEFHATFLAFQPCGYSLCPSIGSVEFSSCLFNAKAVLAADILASPFPFR
ncbi:hypothetical protein EDC04DRAFT_298178 [Pisolithus marmoratus]|nr:hypothetical protein EDC04DRAFT_298178 [Pisolithus marmoratus]